MTAEKPAAMVANQPWLCKEFLRQIFSLVTVEQHMVEWKTLSLIQLRRIVAKWSQLHQ